MSEKINDNFSVSDYFADLARLIPQSFDIENITFKFLPLTDDLIQAVKECDTYVGMLKLAANSGLAYENGGDAFRVVDNEKLAKKIDSLWGKDELKLDLDPCIQYRAGETVCDISGIGTFIADQLEFEAEEAIEAERKRIEELDTEFNIDGVPVPGGTELNNLESAVLDQHAENNINV